MSGNGTYTVEVLWRLGHYLHTSLTDVLLPVGNPGKQKEADQNHRALAANSGSKNDFATLLSVFQLCKSR